MNSHPSTSGTSAQTTSVPPQTFKFNSMQSIQLKNTQQPRGKKKMNKQNNYNNEKGTVSTQNTHEGGTKEKRKNQFPCMIYGEDHPTHQFPRKDEVHKFLAQQFPPPPPPQQLVLLTHPFPPQPHNMVSKNPSPL
jgi:hypothetical protein